MRGNLRKVWQYAALIFFALLILLPFLFMLATSLRPMMDLAKNGAMSLPESVSLDNYSKAWVKGSFITYYKNSIWITAATVGILLACVLPASYALVFLRAWGKRLVLALILFGLIIPFEQIMFPLFTNLRSYHLINTSWSVILPQVALGIPVGIMLMKNYMAGIPDEIIQAARIDGASEAAVLLRIVVPMTKPVISTLLVFFTISSWNSFMLPNIMLQKPEAQTLTVGLNYFKESNSADFPLMIAAAFVVALPVLLVYIIFQKRITEGMLAGSLKG